MCALGLSNVPLSTNFVSCIGPTLLSYLRHKIAIYDKSISGEPGDKGLPGKNGKDGKHSSIILLKICVLYVKVLLFQTIEGKIQKQNKIINYWHGWHAWRK